MEELEHNLGSLRALQLAPLLETKKKCTLLYVSTIQESNPLFLNSSIVLRYSPKRSFCIVTV